MRGGTNGHYDDNDHAANNRGATNDNDDTLLIEVLLKKWGTLDDVPFSLRLFLRRFWRGWRLNAFGALRLFFGCLADNRRNRLQFFPGPKIH